LMLIPSPGRCSTMEAMNKGFLDFLTTVPPFFGDAGDAGFS
jgi:hypothetical protein